jgi:Tol biopolymer transport system component/predicted Ser/Thr protein kinase
MIGQTISHFRILEKLGEGGMGVVYKAEDTQLKRIVALKFLPRGLEAHEPEQARFLQEAQAASAINHPNVCTIHEIVTEGDQQFIVMEYVDGKTLRQLVPIQKTQTAIDYAIQIGEALQEAHSRGIVHRDIKTDNIMVNTKNQIKVMDFGLAKLKGSLKLTKTSSTVGTLAYMAPEQIEGGEVDARSDIFSFGVVLYEMLTGHMPFRGEHEAAMVYSIVNEEPTPIQKYIPETSSESVHILSRALEKDPDDRYQSVAEMVIDLRRQKKETTKVTRYIGEELKPGPTNMPTRLMRWTKRMRSMAVVALVLIVAVGVVYVLTRKPELNPDMKVRVLQIPFRSVTYGSMTPDGNWLVFPAQDDRGKFDVYMMNISQGQIRRVTNDSSFYVYSASISPDAGTILYSRGNDELNPHELVKVPSLGGTGRVLVDSVRSGKFSTDGQKIYYVVVRELPTARSVLQLWTCALDGSGRQIIIVDTVTTRAGLRLRVAFDESPDGMSVVWTKNFPQGFTEIMVRDLKTGLDRQLTFDRKVAHDPMWTSTGHIIYGSNRGGNVNLWIIPASGGESVQLTRGTGPDYPTAMTADAKRLLYGELQQVGHIKLANLKDGTVRQLTVDDRMRGYPSISTSGKMIAFPSQEIDAVSNVRDIYVMDRDGGNVRKITDDLDFKGSPMWSPDEKWITYSAHGVNDPGDSSRVYLIRPDQPGQSKLVGKGSSTFWFNEKQFAVFHGVNTFVASVDRDGYEKFSEDSIYSVPIIDGKYVASYDFHKGIDWFSVTTASSYKSSGTAKAKKLLKGDFSGAFAQGGKQLFHWDTRSGELHRMILPEGKDERVKGAFPGMRGAFGVRGDGEELVYRDYFYRRRFVLIDNVFK